MSSHTELYAAICAKQFPAQAMLRHRPELRDKPFVVMSGTPPLQWVCSLNSSAHRQGIRRGMTRVEVETFASVVALPRSAVEEANAKAAMLECAGRFSPRVEDCNDDGCFLCVLDIAGTEKLFGPPQTLAEALRFSAVELGILASVAVSHNFHAAISFVRGMSSRMDIADIATGDEGAALASLPLAVLTPTAEHAETFALWGITTLGALADLPEDQLIARMGQEGKRLRQLARGELHHLLVPVEPDFRLEERMELDTPVELLDSLLFVIGVMIEQLTVRASTRVLALAAATLTLSLEGGIEYTRTIRPALPTNDRNLWIKLIYLDLQAHPPPAAILSLTLTADPGPMSKVQLGLFSAQVPEPMQLDITLARIRAIVGENSVGRAVLRDTHQPGGFGIEPFSVSTAPVGASRPSQSRTAVRQLRPAESISITLCDRRPATFFFREKRYGVEQAYGPWMASGDWWDPGLWAVEQWDLVARCEDGTLLCCCVVRDCLQDGWRMEALYD